MYNWGHITLASIRGGMSMISSALTIFSFLIMLLSNLIDYGFPSRLLGVLNNINTKIITTGLSGGFFRFTKCS